MTTQSEIETAMGKAMDTHPGATPEAKALRSAYVRGWMEARRDGQAERATRLQSSVMNIQADKEMIRQLESNPPAIDLAYKIGHRDARHAAAELVMEAFAEDEK